MLGSDHHSHLVTIEVDGKPVQAEKGSMLIEATDQAGVNIPRFCYHKKLTVAANCRMCLVQVEKSNKPVPACATPVMEGMKVFTQSSVALEAQKATMEFLLINHPLDCPICDQGGECELQDVAMGYGGDVSRYTEQKRVVKDKNIGPLIQTDMTRCIHCTRCVRFGDEIAGMRELGATGRGEDMKIGTYVEQSVTSELSGNIIDLCPVGALTSKPFRYSARAWEMRQFESIAPHDSIGSNIYVHAKGNSVKRIVPRENEAINEVWISDRDRFSYEGLTSPDRLLKPMVKENGQWHETDWETALRFAVNGLRKILPQHIGGLASATSTFEELYLFQKLLRGIGIANIDHRLMQADFSDQDALPAFPSLGTSLQSLEEVESALLIGTNLRNELPLLNIRLRKAVDHGAEIFVVNPVDFDLTWEAVGRLIQSPSATETVLAGILLALLDGSVIPADLEPMLDGVNATREHKIIADSLRESEDAVVLVGHLASTWPNASKIRALSGLVAKFSGVRFGYLPEAANSVGAWLTGVLPHRGPGAQALDKPGLNSQDMFADMLRGYVLMGTEPELDSLTSVTAVQALKQAECVVSLFGFRSDAMLDYADVLLPMAQFAETSGTYINAEGTWQSFQGIVKPQGEARPAWKVLRVLGNMFGLDGFSYDSSEDVLADATRQIGKDSTQLDNTQNVGRWVVPKELSKEDLGIELVFDTPVYFTDALVRRAPALQAMQNNWASIIQINPELAAKLKVKDGDKIRIAQELHSVELDCALDARVPKTCVLWRRGLTPEPDFGIQPGHFTLEKVQ